MKKKRVEENLNSFNTLSHFELEGEKFYYHSLQTFSKNHDISKLPFSLKILLENLLRNEDGVAVKKKDLEAISHWDPKAEPSYEIQFMPARVLLQDFTGVPAVADLAAMRAAVKRLGGDPTRINPLQPADLVIDHSVQVDEFGTPSSFQVNSDIEFERNSERYEFLKWGQSTFKNFRVVPPDTGIVHQINLEYLAQVAMTTQKNGNTWIYPDTLVGTDSHTTMVNGLGVLGWGVGGIEAEAALLGQPCSMLIPHVVGLQLTGKLPKNATATDLVLTVTQILRKKGVVGKFVEFYGPGLACLSLADRATLANMAPEYGATVGLFPIDSVTTQYLRLTGRESAALLVETYYQKQGLWYSPTQPAPSYSETLSLSLDTIEPSLAGPARPQDRVNLSQVRSSFRKSLPTLIPDQMKEIDPKALDEWTQTPGQSTDKTPELLNPHPDTHLGALGKTAPVELPATSSSNHPQHFQICQGSVVIAAITSCTNTSNPSVLMAAGLLAKKAVERGLQVKPWVKTSLAPGSKVVTDYLIEAGLMPYLEKLKFYLVGYGCTTCIGNSGPLPDAISKAVSEKNLAVVSVLSGNRNFEGRVNTQVRANYLTSPPLVIAYALAGNINLDLNITALGTDLQGKPVFLKDIWPSSEEVSEQVNRHITAQQFRKSYSDVFTGDEKWKKLQVPEGSLYQWDPASTYIKEPPFFENLSLKPEKLQDIRGARVLAFLGDSVTTDHISPAGSISRSSPAGKYLLTLGVSTQDFNSYGARRGNHEVMVRGTFANVRLKNKLVPETEGGVTLHLPEGKLMSIYEASLLYQANHVPLVILAGKEYGTGSSRDWAAKGSKLLGIKAVLAESFERIHRSNLVGMGILPLQFLEGESAKSLGLSGTETFDIPHLADLLAGQKIKITAYSSNQSTIIFTALVRIDTPNEVEYFRQGGILPYVLRQTLKT